MLARDKHSSLLRKLVKSLPLASASNILLACKNLRASNTLAYFKAKKSLKTLAPGGSPLSGWLSLCPYHGQYRGLGNDNKAVKLMSLGASSVYRH